MASTYLSRTQSTPTNPKKWTISYWGRYNLTNNDWYPTFGCDYDGGDSYFGIGSGGQGRNEIGLLEYHTSATNYGQGYTASSLRDSSAWYHIVFAYDSTQSTASDRGKTYINGVQQTNTYSPDIPQNHDSRFNMSGSAISIGRRSAGSGQYMDGILSHFHFIDGTAYDASAFGETDSTTGIWKAKTAPSVTYGTNGFFLKFENSGAFGTDSSPNGNNFAVNGTMTQTIDTPSNVFCTLNSLINNSVSITNANLTASGTSNAFTSIAGTLAVTKGKYYWEGKINLLTGGIAQLFAFMGVSKHDGTTKDISYFSLTYMGNSTMNGVGYYTDNGQIYNNAVATAYGDYFKDVSGNIMGVALDLDNSKIYFSKNGVWQNSGDPTSGATGTGAYDLSSWNDGSPVVPTLTVQDYSGTNKSQIQCNFGNGYFGTTPVSSAENPDDGIGIFEYAVPTGYKALCTKSINAQEYS